MVLINWSGHSINNLDEMRSWSVVGLKLGIIGAGSMGRTHASYYAQMEDVEIAGVVGKGPERGRKLSESLHVPLVDSVAKLLKDKSVEAVDICTPSSSHREIAVAALKAGKHVFCETPLALTVPDGEFMVRAAHDAKKLLLVAQVMRFVAANRLIKEEVSSGKLGKPLSVYAGRFTSPYWKGKGAKHFEDYGEPVVDLMIHDFDYISWLLGHVPTTVTGTGTRGVSGAFEHAFVGLHFRGAHGLAEGSVMMPSSWPFTTLHRVVCERGAYEVRFRFLPKGPSTEFMFYPRSGAPEVPKYIDVDPYREECVHFVNCVRNHADPGPLGSESALDSLRIALAAGQALKTDKPLIITPHPGRRGLVSPYLPNTPSRQTKARRQ